MIDKIETIIQNTKYDRKTAIGCRPHQDSGCGYRCQIQCCFFSPPLLSSCSVALPSCYHKIIISFFMKLHPWTMDHGNVAAQLREHHPDSPQGIIDAHVYEINNNQQPKCQFLCDTRNRSNFPDIDDFLQSHKLFNTNNPSHSEQDRRRRVTNYQKAYGSKLFLPLSQYTQSRQSCFAGDCNDIIQNEAILLKALQRPNSIQCTKQWTQIESRYSLKFRLYAFC